MRLFLPLVAIAFAAISGLAQAQTTPLPSPSPCVADANSLSIGTRIIHIIAMSNGAAINHVGPLFDMHGVAAPVSVTVSGCSTDASAAAQMQSTSWSPVGNAFLPMQVGSGPDQVTLAAIPANVPFQLVNSAPVALSPTAGAQSFHVAQAVSFLIDSTPVDFTSFDLAAEPNGYRIDVPAFTFGPQSTGLHGSLHAVVPTTTSAATPFTASLDVGPVRIDNLSFSTAAGNATFKGALTLSPAAAQLHGLTLTSNNSQIAVALITGGNVSVNCTCNLDLSYSDGLFHGHGAITGAQFSSGALSFAGTLSYAMGGTGGNATFSIGGSGNSLVLSSQQSGGGLLHFNSLSLSSLSGSTSAAFTGLSIDIAGAGNVSIPSLAISDVPGQRPAVTLSGIDLSNLHSDLVKGIQIATPIASASDAGCTGASGAYLCIHFSPSIDLGIGDLDYANSKPGTHSLSFADSHLILGGHAPLLSLGSLQETHVHLAGGLAFNLTSCNDPQGYNSDTSMLGALCLTGTVTLPNAFASVLESRTVKIARFDAYGARTFDVCLVECSIPDEDNAFKVVDPSQVASPPLNILMVPTYALQIRALRFFGYSDDKGQEHLSGSGSMRIVQQPDPKSSPQPVAQLDVSYLPNSENQQEFDINGSVLRPLRYSDMSFIVTGFKGRFWENNFQLHASGVASLVNEPLTAVVDDVGVDGTRDPQAQSRFGGWKFSVSHRLNRGETLAATSVRAVPKLFQLLENIATLYFAKWIVK